MIPMTMFSIITPVYRPSATNLQLTIESVMAQSCADWEWILVDDASGDLGVIDTLDRAVAADTRIKCVKRAENGHIVAASNDALERASGEWIVLLDHDDLLVPDALAQVRDVIRANPGAGYVYSDEDKIDGSGFLSGRFLKPDWSPERLRHQMYLGHLSALRRDLVQRVGGFRQGFDGSQDHDLALRVTELTNCVIHIPEVLYHWRIVPGSTAGDPEAKDYATLAGLRAVKDHLLRVGRLEDDVIPAKVAHTYVTKRQLNASTLVSVVIATRGTAGIVWGEERVFVVEAVKSLLAHTNHDLIEVVVVYDVDTPASVLDELSEICPRSLVLIPYSQPFSFSDKCNVGFLNSSGSTVVFLNDDVEICSDGFIENLCSPLEEESVGMTGARLLYSDGTIQHAGLVFQEGEFMHAYQGVPDGDVGYFGELVVDREVAGLTAACIALRRDVFTKVGGFTLSLPNNFNDVDISYKVRDCGYSLVWLAGSIAYHFESMSRTTSVKSTEVSVILSRWGSQSRDAYMPYEADNLVSRKKRLEAISDRS